MASMQMSSLWTRRGKGCDEVLLNTILKMKPERIVYVSCDSATSGQGSEGICVRRIMS